MAGRRQNLSLMWKKLTSFLDHVYLGCTQKNSHEHITEEYKQMFESRISAGATQKLLGWEKYLTRKLSLGLMTWKVG